MYDAIKMKFGMLLDLKIKKVIVLALAILTAMLFHGCQRTKLQSFDDKALCLYLNVHSPSAALMEQVVTELRKRRLDCQKIIADMNYEYEFLKRTQKSHIRANTYGNSLKGMVSPLGNAKLLSEELRKKCLGMGGTIITGECKFK